MLFAFNESMGDFSDLLLADPNSFNQVTPLTQNAATGVDDYDGTWQPLNPPACDLAGSATQKSVKSIGLTVSLRERERRAVVATGSAATALAGLASRAAASTKTLSERDLGARLRRRFGVLAVHLRRGRAAAGGPGDAATETAIPSC